MRGLAPIFAALGDETRLRLLARLGGDGPLSIARLTADTDVTRQAVTKHLRVLEDAGLTRGTRRGRERLFEVEAGSLDDASAWLDRISRRWDVALARLKASVER